MASHGLALRPRSRSGDPALRGSAGHGSRTSRGTLTLASRDKTLKAAKTPRPHPPPRGTLYISTVFAENKIFEIVFVKQSLVYNVN